MFRIHIDEDYCKGCSICIDFCPHGVFEISDKISRRGYYVPVPVHEDKCTGCRFSELLCPEFSIILSKE